MASTSPADRPTPLRRDHRSRRDGLDGDGKKLQCVVVTPERAVLDEPADFVVLPLYDGELGVLPGRAPLIGRLGYGELRTEARRRDENATSSTAASPRSATTW